MDITDHTLDFQKEMIPWRLFVPEKSNKEYCVLWLQGWSSAMDTHSEGISRMSAKSGVVFATLDTAGHGLHKFPLEKSTRKQRIEEIAALYDELINRGFEKVIVIGGSHGGYMAALLTSYRNIHTAVLRAPANYPDNEFDTPYEETMHGTDYWNYVKRMGTEEVLSNSKASKAIQKFDGFVYVVEHELDEIIPVEVPKHYFELAQHGNYLIVPRTKHTPKVMKDPQSHYDYIENLMAAIVTSAIKQDLLSAD